MYASHTPPINNVANDTVRGANVAPSPAHISLALSAWSNSISGQLIRWMKYAPEPDIDPNVQLRHQGLRVM